MHIIYIYICIHRHRHMYRHVYDCTLCVYVCMFRIRIQNVYKLLVLQKAGKKSNSTKKSYSYFCKSQNLVQILKYRFMKSLT